MEVLLEVIERMKERKIAPILAQMNPQRAQTVTLELAQRRDLPIPRQ
jgi:flagellar motility protein MotE (MotC chaperone)